MLKIKNLNKTFYPGTKEEQIIFRDFNIEIEDSMCTAILGPNGCGKSTLFNLISGSLKEDSGSIELNGVELTELSEEKRAAYIGKVNQAPLKGVSPNLSILENMALADRKGEKFRLKKMLPNADKEKIIKKLESLGLGLENKLNSKIRLLSGGQAQSLSLIMAAMNKPALLLLDEHTAALDPKTSNVVMDKTEELIEKESIMTCMITHDLRAAIRYSDRIVMLNKGKIVLDVLASDITEDDLRKFYDSTLDLAAEI